MRLARLALLLLASSCSTPPLPAPTQITAAATAGPPIAARKPFPVESPNGIRIDDYYWLRDDTRQSKEVLDYLTAENAWRDTAMAHTEALQKELYDELAARVDPDESSVPVPTGTAPPTWSSSRWTSWRAWRRWCRSRGRT